jgi:squalene-associated FAD-dependent desaturase
MTDAPEPLDVAVVGAGWAGLATAVELVRRGHRPTVLEAGPAPGGRARRVELGGMTLDNGQHLLLGAYRDTLALLRTVGVAPDSVLLRRRLELDIEGPDAVLRLRMPHGPARPALALALLRCGGIPAADRWRALARALRLQRAPAGDGTVSEWLEEIGQPASLRRRLWEPLCLAALNAPAARASARAFARVLRETFAAAGNSDLLLPRADLEAVFPGPAVTWLRAQGVEVRLGTRVRGVRRCPERTGWVLEAPGTVLRARRLVLATEPRAASRLLPEAPECETTRSRLERLGSAPIATVYLRYGPEVRLPRPMVGRLDGPAQWLFDRRITGLPGVIAAVISGDGEHMGWSRDRLGATVAGQLERRAPGWPRPRDIIVVREKRATFDCRPGTEALRCGVRGPLPDLWLAGDHVANGLPATLEGAVRAGRACAADIDDGNGRMDGGSVRY